MNRVQLDVAVSASGDFVHAVRMEITEDGEPIAAYHFTIDVARRIGALFTEVSDAISSEACAALLRPPD